MFLKIGRWCVEGWSFPGHSLTLSQGLEEQSPKGLEARWSHPVGSAEQGCGVGAALAGTGVPGCSPDDLRASSVRSPLLTWKFRQKAACHILSVFLIYLLFNMQGYVLSPGPLPSPGPPCGFWPRVCSQPPAVPGCPLCDGLPAGPVQGVHLSVAGCGRSLWL